MCVQGYDCMLEVYGPPDAGSPGISPGWVLLHWAVQGQTGGLGPGVSFALEVNSWVKEVRIWIWGMQVSCYLVVGARSRIWTGAVQPDISSAGLWPGQSCNAIQALQLCLVCWAGLGWAGLQCSWECSWAA